MAKWVNDKKPQPPGANTPRPYLSWSQLACFEKSPAEYAMRYIYRDNPENQRMALGKRVAEMIEKGEEEADKDLEYFRIFLPQYPYREFEVWKDKEKGEYITFAGIPIFGKLDGWNPEARHIGEYKTGAKWDQRMADTTGQLSFYALLIYIAYGIPPEKLKITLHWMPTTIDPREGLKLTGDIKEFQTRRTQKDLVEIGSRIVKAWAGIRALCAEEYKAIGLA